MSPASTARTRKIVHQIAEQCQVSPDMIEDAYPCTTFQADLFAASTKGAGIMHNNIVFSLDEPTSGMFDRGHKAFQSVYDRNPVLRSRIVQYKDFEMATPCVAQAIVREEFRWHEFDDLERYCHETIGHCLRYGDQLVQYGISKDRKHLVWSLHHAIYDGWSLGMLWKDLCDTWAARDTRSALTQRPNYVKFIAHLQNPMAELDRRFWVEHLADYTGPILGRYEPAPASDARRGGSLGLVKARESVVSTTARIQAAWFCTIFELYGSLDAMTLNVATGRNSGVQGIADMVGPCICLTPFRQRASLDTSLYQFMLDVEKCSSALLAHEQTGMQCLESLVEEARRPVHTFNLKSGLGEDFSGFPGLEYQPAQGILKKRWDWGMGVSVGDETMRWDMFFDSSRLDQNAVALICERFPLMLQTCQALESHSAMNLKDVIDVQRV